MIDARELLSAEEDAWAELGLASDAIPDDRFEILGLTPDGRPAKVLLHHVASWMDVAGEQLEAMIAGTFDNRRDAARWVEGQRGRRFERSLAIPAAEVRAFAERARTRMRDAVQALPELTPEAVEWFEESGVLHYRAHAEDLRGWTARLHGQGVDRP